MTSPLFRHPLLSLAVIAGSVQAACLVAQTQPASTQTSVSQPAVAHSATGTDKLTVYFVDVEGGQATLFVTPTGESLLIDTGSHIAAGADAAASGVTDARDAARIAAAARLAGLSRIDYLLITHYHSDHVGGLPQLLELIPVGTFIDHGPNRETDNKPTVTGYNAYQKVLAAGTSKHLVLRPGDSLPIGGMGSMVISADGNLLDKPLPGAGQPNTFCKTSEVRMPDQTENARSLGVELTFGKLKILDLGDLTWDKEMELMCPNNKLGRVDILIVSHHGIFQSSSPALVQAVHPRVAIMDNGADKGGSVPTFQTLAGSTGLETLWQLHYSNSAAALNQQAEWIANLQGPDTGHYLKLTANPDGAFEVMNSRTGSTQHYKPEPAEAGLPVLPRPQKP